MSDNYITNTEADAIRDMMTEMDRLFDLHNKVVGIETFVWDTNADELGRIEWNESVGQHVFIPSNGITKGVDKLRQT